MRLLTIISFVTIFILGTSFKEPDDTLEDLQKIYQKEANAAYKYDLFAQKAMDEGNKDAAKLFYAASESERILMRNHRDNILALGGTIGSVTYKEVEVKSTKKNLKESRQSERKASRAVSMNYLGDAQDEQYLPAVRSLMYARNTDMQHRKLFDRALDNLGRDVSDNYYVNYVTGETMALPATSMGPVQDGRYIKVE